MKRKNRDVLPKGCGDCHLGKSGYCPFLAMQERGIDVSLTRCPYYTEPENADPEDQRYEIAATCKYHLN